MSVETMPTPKAEEGATEAVPRSGTQIYTCPMHPEVRQDSPGACPKCGMALEPEPPAGPMDEVESTELHEMTWRLWVGAVLAVLHPRLALRHDASPKYVHADRHWGGSGLCIQYRGRCWRRTCSPARSNMEARSASTLKLRGWSQ